MCIIGYDPCVLDGDLDSGSHDHGIACVSLVCSLLDGGRGPGNCVTTSCAMCCNVVVSPNSIKASSEQITITNTNNNVVKVVIWQVQHFEKYIDP